jgi:hypothetical protein
MMLRRVFVAHVTAALVLFLFAGAVRAAEEAEPGVAPAAEPAKPAGEQTANGLEISLVQKDRSFTFGDNTITRKMLVLVLKNVSDKPIVLRFQLSAASFGFGGFGRFGGAGGAPSEALVKFSAKDAAGKDVPQDPGRGDRGEQQPKPEDKPIVLTVLKPGKTLEQDLMGGLGLRFPADGKYTICAELDQKEGEEVLPGVKTWAGKIKSNGLEYDYRNRGGRGNRGNQGNRGNRGGGGGQNPAPPAGGVEAF